MRYKNFFIRAKGLVLIADWIPTVRVLVLRRPLKPFWTYWWFYIFKKHKKKKREKKIIWWYIKNNELNLSKEQILKSFIERNKWKEKVKLNLKIKNLKKNYKKKGIKEDLYNFVMDKGLDIISLTRREVNVGPLMYQTDKRFIELFYYLKWKEIRNPLKKKDNEEEKIFQKWNEKIQNYLDWNENFIKQKTLDYLKWEKKYSNTVITYYKLIFCEQQFQIWKDYYLDNNQKFLLINIFCMKKIESILFLKEKKFFNLIMNKNNIENIIFSYENINNVFIYLKEIYFYNLFKIWEILLFKQIKEYFDWEINSFITDILYFKKGLFYEYKIISEKLLEQSLIKNKKFKKKQKLKRKKYIYNWIEKKKKIKKKVFINSFFKKELINLYLIHKNYLKKKKLYSIIKKRKKKKLLKIILKQLNYLEEKKNFQKILQRGLIPYEDLLFYNEFQKNLIEKLENIDINFFIKIINYAEINDSNKIIAEFLNEDILIKNDILEKGFIKILLKKKKKNFFFIEHFNNIKISYISNMTIELDKEKKLWEIWEQKILINEQINFFWKKKNWIEYKLYLYKNWEKSNDLYEDLEEQWRLEKKKIRNKWKQYDNIKWLQDYKVNEYLLEKKKEIIDNFIKLLFFFNKNNYIKKKLNNYVKLQKKDLQTIEIELNNIKYKYKEYVFQKEEYKKIYLRTLPIEQQVFFKNYIKKLRKRKKKRESLKKKIEEYDKFRFLRKKNSEKEWQKLNKIQIFNWIRFEENKEKKKKKIKKIKKYKEKWKIKKYLLYWKKKKTKKKKKIKIYQNSARFWSNNNYDNISVKEKKWYKIYEENNESISMYDWYKIYYDYDKADYLNKEEREWKVYLSSVENEIEKLYRRMNLNYIWYLNFWKMQKKKWNLMDWKIYKKWVKMRWILWEIQLKTWTKYNWINWEKNIYVIFKMLVNLWLVDRAHILYLVERNYKLYYGDIFINVWEIWQANRISFLSFKMLKNLNKKKKIKNDLQLKNEFIIKKFTK